MNGTRYREREMSVRTFVVQGADGRFYEFRLKSEDLELLNRIERELNVDNRADLLFNFVQRNAGTRRLEVRVARNENGPWTTITDKNYMRNKMFQRDISPPRREIVVGEEEGLVVSPRRTTATTPTRRRTAAVEQEPETVATHRYAIEIGNQRFEFTWKGPRPANAIELCCNVDRIQGDVSYSRGEAVRETLEAEEAARRILHAIREARAYGREGRLIVLR